MSNNFPAVQTAPLQEFQTTSQRAGKRALWEIGFLLGLTSVHHIYGAIHYATPWRYHTVLSGRARSGDMQ